MVIFFNKIIILVSNKTFIFFTQKRNPGLYHKLISPIRLISNKKNFFFHQVYLKNKTNILTFVEIQKDIIDMFYYYIDNK